MFTRILCRLLILCLAGLPLRASADLVSTDKVIAPGATMQPAAADRAALARKLEGYGLAATDVSARVAALTDDEVVRLNTEVDRLPAGAGGAALAVLVIVALILLVLWYTPG